MLRDVKYAGWVAAVAVVLLARGVRAGRDVAPRQDAGAGALERTIVLRCHAAFNECTCAWECTYSRRRRGTRRDVTPIRPTTRARSVADAQPSLLNRCRSARGRRYASRSAT
jgi:hypothetical protein